MLGQNFFKITLASQNCKIQNQIKLNQVVRIKFVYVNL